MTTEQARPLIVGAGRIGTALYNLLNYDGHHPDLSDLLSGISKEEKYTDIFACVPYHAIPEVAAYAASLDANFYDFTEHVEIKGEVRDIYMKRYGSYPNFKSAVVNGCGVAPGICNMIAGDLMGKMRRVDSVSMCVGGVPQNKDVNPLHYYNIWSLEGLWNLYYGNPITYRWKGQLETASLGRGTRRMEILGGEYEAFLTGGTVVQDLLEDKEIASVSYSTIRHVGHIGKITVLDSLLDFRNNPKLFQDIIAQLPKEEEMDKVIISVEVTGTTWEGSSQKLVHEMIYMPTRGLGAMQYCTALGGLTAFQNVKARKLCGYVRQEDLELQ